MTDQKRKSIELFRGFSRTEMNDFCHAVQNKSFNPDEKLAVLAQFLHKAFWGKTPKNFDEKAECQAYITMFSETESKEILNDKERRKLNDKLSRLTKLGSRYLSVIAIETDSPEKTKLMLKQFSNRQLHRFFEAYQKKEKKKLKQQKKDADFYLNNYQIERNVFEHQFKYGLNQLLKSDNLADAIKALDVYYLMDRMLLQLAGMTLTNTSAKFYDFQAMEWILGLSKLPQYKDIPPISICRTACYMESCKLQSADDASKDEEAQQHFNQFTKLLYEYDDEFSKELTFHFYTLAINFCAHQIKLKNQVFNQKGFEIYWQMENKGLLVTNGSVRAATLIRGITLACRTANFEWAEKMLDKYIAHTETAIRDGVSAFLAGQIAFYKGNFEKADQYFSVAEQQPFDRTYSVNNKIFRLKCMYELGHYNYEAAHVKFKSEIKYRERNKILSDKDRKSQNNFIRLIIDLYKIRNLLKIERKEQIGKRLKKVKSKLNDYQYVTATPWLLDKLDELSKQISKK